MTKNYVSKGLSLLLALIMVFSMLPTSAFAAAEEDHEHCETCGEHDCICEPVEGDAEFSAAYLEIQAWIDEMLCWYLGDSAQVTEELLAEIAAMSSEEVADKVIAARKAD